MAWPLRPLQQLQQRLGALGFPESSPQPRCRTALSGEPALEAAVTDLAQQLQAGGGRPADLALVFCSTAYATDLQRLLPLLRQAIPSQRWIGCAGGGVVGTAADGEPHELEQQPGISVSLLWLPGAQLQVFQVQGDDLPDLDGPSQAWADWVGGNPEGVHSMLLFIDPGCPGINDLISGLDYAYPAAAKVGGIAGQHNASHGSLLVDDQVVGGAVGCLISGSWRIDPVVAQGCKPIGPVFEVEQAERNVVQRLSSADQQGTPVACLQGILEGLEPRERELVRHSLFLGVAKNSFQLHGNGDGDAQLMQVRCSPCGALVVRKGMVEPTFSNRVRTALDPMGRLVVTFVEAAAEVVDCRRVHQAVDDRTLTISVERAAGTESNGAAPLEVVWFVEVAGQQPSPAKVQPLQGSIQVRHLDVRRETKFLCHTVESTGVGDVARGNL